MTLKFTKEHPMKLEFNNWLIQAWEDKEVEGGVMIKLGCQTHPIMTWRKHGLGIVAMHKYELKELIKQEEIATVLFSPKEAWHAFFEELFTRKEAFVERTTRKAVEWTGLLNAALAAVEAAFDPEERKRRVNDRVLPPPKRRRKPAAKKKTPQTKTTA